MTRTRGLQMHSTSCEKKEGPRSIRVVEVIAVFKIVGTAATTHLFWDQAIPRLKQLFLPQFCMYLLSSLSRITLLYGGQGMVTTPG